MLNDPSELNYKEISKEIHTASLNKKLVAEEDVYNFARSSLVADKEIKKGHIIDDSDIWAHRPGSGEIPGSQLIRLLKKALTDIKKKSAVNLGSFD